MRRVLTVGCIFLGVFLIVMAVMLQTYGSSNLKKTPLDVDSVTHTAGDAVSYTAGFTPFQAKATTTTKADTEASTDDVVVFRTSNCVVKDLGDVGDCVSGDDPQARLVTASEEDFAVDRNTAMPVETEELGKPACMGLMNKWPFDVEKKTYPYCTTTGAVDATYDGTEDIQGLETYKFQVDVPPTAAEIASGVEGLYSEQTTIWVEPITGQFVKVDTSQQRALDETTKALDIHLIYTDEQIDEGVKDIGDDADLLKLATSTAPLVGYAVGIPLLLVGLALLLLARRNEGARGEHNAPRDRKLADA